MAHAPVLSNLKVQSETLTNLMNIHNVPMFSKKQGNLKAINLTR